MIPFISEFNFRSLDSRFQKIADIPGYRSPKSREGPTILMFIGDTVNCYMFLNCNNVISQSRRCLQELKTANLYVVAKLSSTNKNGNTGFELALLERRVPA